MERVTIKPKVSVVAAVYNNGQYIRQCVESILSQTFREFEFIVVDDGSTDSTVDILGEYQKKDKRLKLFRNNQNMGIAYSRNKALGKAKADYIAVMDSDDVAFSQRFKRQFEFLNSNQEYAGCGSLYTYIDEKGSSFQISEVIPKEGEVKNLLNDPCQLCHTTCMFRREVFKNVGGYRRVFERAVDYDFLLRVTEKYKIYNIPEVLVKVRFSLTRGTVKERRKQFLYSELARKLYNQRQESGEDMLNRGDEAAFEELKREVFGIEWQPEWMRVSSNYLLWAHRMYHRGPIDYARKLIKESIKYNPLNVKSWLYMLFLYLPGYARRKSTAMKKVFFG